MLNVYVCWKEVKEMKYLKWAFGTNIANKENEEFKINEEITADRWDPANKDWNLKGGFNFTNEKCIKMDG